MFIDDLLSCREMEGSRRHGAQVSPERSKVWTEPSPKNQIKRQQGSKVPVVYYLSKNRHLEHPHFIEVPISSPEGLYLRDVMNRLVVLRGKRMPALYSWSCKRSYKNGFVWQDLSEDDIILPALGNEYILKGSELLNQTPQDRFQGSNNNSRLQNAVPLQRESPACSGVPEISVANSSTVSTVREGKLTSPTPCTPPLDADDSSLPHNQRLSPEIRFPNFGECSVFKLSGAQDASTQTEDRGGRKSQERSARTAGVSNDDGFAEAKVCESQQNRDAQSNEAIKREVTTSRMPSTASSGGKINTLESLIRDEVNKLNSFRIIEEEEVMPIKAKMKRTNALLQLLTCGSTLVKDHHSLGFIPTYRPRFSSTRLSPLYPSSTTLRELDCLSESSRVRSLVHGQRDSFSRTPSESCPTHKEEREVFHSTNCTTFYHGDMSCKSPDLRGNKQPVADLVVSNSCPRTMENFSSKVMMNGTFKSPILDARSSSTQQSHCKSPSASFGSKRTTDITSSKGSSIGVESFQQDDKRTIKIDERLTSGARIIIQSRVEPDDNENSTGS